MRIWEIEPAIFILGSQSMNYGSLKSIFNCFIKETHFSIIAYGMSEFFLYHYSKGAITFGFDFIGFFDTVHT